VSISHSLKNCIPKEKLYSLNLNKITDLLLNMSKKNTANRSLKKTSNKPEKLLIEITAPDFNIGAFIRHLRKKRHYSQTNLGKLLGVNKAQISRIENNYSNLTLNTIINIFEALKVNASLQVELYKDEAYEKTKAISIEL
jgi:HTH-type transcriptional regulator / antitoxin HipB